MAHGALKTTTAALALAFSMSACGAPPSHVPRATGAESAHARTRGYTSDDARWGTFHSKRFQLSVPLPDGRAWRIDDHRHRELIATHEGTSSRLTLLTTRETELMNRERCEARARAFGWFDERRLTTVEDQVYLGPDTYDSRVWVALEATRPDEELVGHVFLFGAFMRQCLLVHLTTRVTSSKDEEVLAARLVVGSARIVKGITLDPMRTTGTAVVPRDKPPARPSRR